MPSISSNSALLSQVEEVKRAAQAHDPQHPEAHANLLKAIHKLTIAAETPLETVLRVIFQPQQNVSLRVAVKMGLIKVLVKRGGSPVSATDLARECGGDEILIARIMRVLTAMAICNEVGPDTYCTNRVTKALNAPEISAGVQFSFDTAMATATNLVDYLEKNNYQNPTSYSQSPFAYAFGTPFFEWLEQNPSVQTNFNAWMDGRRKGKANWLDTFPFKEQIIDGARKDAGATALVDIGGNQGHVVNELIAKYPDIPGRLVLQDQSSVIHQMTGLSDGVEAMSYDFFTPQPIKGARAYYFRAILHDWPDDACRTILKNTASAMTKGYSKVIITDYVLYNTGTALLPASSDLLMMSLSAGVERTEKQWRTLLDSAGLVIVKVWTTDSGIEAVIEAMLKN